MGNVVVQRILQTRKSCPLTVFLAILIFTLVASPVLQAERYRAPVAQVVFSALLLAGVWAASERRRELMAMAVFIAVPLACVWLGYVHPVPSIVVAKTASMGVFCLCMLAIVARRVFSGESVTADTIAGGIVVYLLAGFAFACVIAIVDFYDPGSVQLGLASIPASAGQAASGQVLPYMYYSFMTLLTVGYGDVIPATGVTRMLAVLEALFGQLYIAVLIGGSWARTCRAGIGRAPDQRTNFHTLRRTATPLRRWGVQASAGHGRLPGLPCGPAGSTAQGSTADVLKEIVIMPLVPMRILLDHAAENNYGLAAFNVNDMEQIQAIMMAAEETESPVIVQASRGAREYTNDAYLRHLMLAAAELYRRSRSPCTRTTATRRTPASARSNRASRPS